MRGERINRKPISDEFIKFKVALALIRHVPGKRVTLLTIADDTVSGYKQSYSEVAPLAYGNKLQAALRDLVKILVPEGESKQTLEKAFDDEPDEIKHKWLHADRAMSEWQTTLDNVVVGIEAVRDQRSESARSWYLRNTQKDKKPRPYIPLLGRIL